MRIEKDFEDFVKQLNQEKVKYCIIGCMATNLHGRPRYTGDLDIFVEPTVENSVKMHKAIKEFGADVSDLEPDYFSKIGNYYQIGVTPVQIHISTKIDAVNFDEIWENIEPNILKEIACAKCMYPNGLCGDSDISQSIVNSPPTVMKWYLKKIITRKELIEEPKKG